MLRKLSLAIAVSCASNAVVWAADMPTTVKTDRSAFTGRRSTTTPTWPPPAPTTALVAKWSPGQGRTAAEPVGRCRDAQHPHQDRRALHHVQPQRQFPSATLAQPIFRADRWFQLQAAEAVNEQAALELSATEQNLILQTAENYFAVLRAQDNLASTKAEEAAFKRQLDQSNERFDVGLSDKTDVLQSQASYDTARANRIIAERRYRMPSRPW